MNIPKNESSSPVYAGNEAITRRSFTKRLLVATAALAAIPVFGNADHAGVYDYIIVGAGAGGGPVAANLANAGYKVALVEAGVDPLGAEAQAVDRNAGILYRVPLFASAAAEDPSLSWSFFVKHYADPVQQSKDSKFVLDKGVLYPRGSCLGGSTAHNVMNWVYPHDDDWNGIAEITGDDSWRAGSMRDFFVRLENCEYCQPLDPGHGFNGYMPAAVLDRNIFNFDSRLQDLASARLTLPDSFFQGNTALDINHPLVAKGDTGSFVMAMHVSGRMRVSIREHLVETQQTHPDRLFLITGALASKVLFEGRCAVGVEFLQGANLYEADKLFDPLVVPRTHRIFARKEVILSAGVFNTPQLLKLSGIGPAAELRRHGIRVVADAPGVGANMQDRYEIAVSAVLKQSVQPFATCEPNHASDPCFSAWFNGRFPGVRGEFFGPYANNGVLTVRLVRSDPSRELPDLCIFGGMTAFNGYAPGFSQNGFADQRWSWLILKAHTNNNAGVVELKSASPRQMPEINFHYFNEGTDAAGEDLRSVVRGVEIARGFLNDPAAARHIDHEIVPGSQVQTAGEIETYVRNEAWGHHASCTAKIGSDDDRMAVLDSRFRVRGVKGLRVVDACVFPRIPGFFPVAAILMVGEKASDVLLEDAGSGAR